ncbi:MAG: hypothetical protein UX85_C0001G0042 [Candidatus Beckwithbacteria bacterium GW2011_GWB1_47_15]|uniref:Glycosyltransferase RgtA/B/C/D-like domain-containing protein n=1 Tax=Candidatus Beckwithbacteria bacterium GW2011_GWB1_47_15 TaxID=1618371 RepID=A0A0G1U6E2_9BACT|nr:MAG: hypothetical protein UY43_C0001G1086 [Candidatus Beckwithbacteria bacterium GW2011_GWC1_49_16]AQS30676.1 hypothetical protein [uncultured bacterium]KKU35864.1 MAG: hypothetical protein UX50_C0001G0041 [Candidatus Beckwithbacteria bacterium GW2011_GWA1_46_30]KKU61828.1 MAG: hypothetical protein UX85_C0001G0042 [Candidatus Beckwithbacteria bacterium GW2011_GWB1_47_15]KKU72618.1 MAG: hypothetical protein UX97_C0001G0488 [Candidatus Beckwithbacteria bacterium GW2011_GWA2_47_25]KKW04214.1 M
MLKRVWRWVKKNEALAWLVVFSVVLRITSWFEPYWYGDEGIYLVLGQALRRGLVFYRDIHDNKPPLLYLLAAVAGGVTWFRVILTVWFGATVVVFYRLMEKLFPKNKLAWYLSTITMILGTTATEGNIANAEIFMIGPIMLAMLMALRQTPASAKASAGKRNWLLVGLLMAVAFLFKAPAGADLAALLIWLVAFTRLGKKAWLKAALILVGFLLPLAATLVYYAQVGGLERYVRSALLQNIGYLSSWQTGEHSASGFSSQSGLMLRSGALAVLIGGFFWLKKRFKLETKLSLMVVWFFAALWAALLSERPYPHYLIQPLVPAAVLVSFLLFGKRKLVRLVVVTAALVAAVSFYQIRFWQYPVAAYYQNFIGYALGQKSREAYFDFFDWRVNQTYRVAELVKKYTTSDEPIFVWGDEPYIYALSERLPVGRYTVAYHIYDFDGFEETLTALDEKRPSLVVMMEYETRPFEGLTARLATDYVLVDKVDQALIYMRVDGVTRSPGL